MMLLITISMSRVMQNNMQNNKENIYQKFPMAGLALGSSNVAQNLLLWNFLPLSFMCWLSMQVNFPQDSKKLQLTICWPDWMTSLSLTIILKSLTLFWLDKLKSGVDSWNIYSNAIFWVVQAWIRCLSLNQSLWTWARLNHSCWS